MQNVRIYNEFPLNLHPSFQDTEIQTLKSLLLKDHRILPSDITIQGPNIQISHMGDHSTWDILYTLDLQFRQWDIDFFHISIREFRDKDNTYYLNITLESIQP